MAKRVLIYVDIPKLKRAEEIVGFLGGKNPKTNDGQALKDKFLDLVKEDDVKEDDWLEYVYTKLGGLVRTEAQQKAAVERAKKIKEENEKKSKKDEDEV